MTNITTGTTTAVSAFAPELSSNNGQITTTSTQIAQHFGKRHDTVLRAVRNLVAELSEERRRNFAETSAEVQQPNGGVRTESAYRITRDGFTLLAMGFTGKEALQWKLAYIDAFNKMESELTRVALPSATITPAQAQHLRELVDLIVASGKQGHGETWSRLHRKMHVNSYLALRPNQFSTACDYLGGKFDSQSIATLIQKHLPHAVPAITMKNAPQALPAQQPQAMDVQTLCQLILGGVFTGMDFIQLAYAVNQRQYCVSSANQNRGIGEEMASKLKGISDADLHIINTKASLEVWMRSDIPVKACAPNPTH